MKIHTTKFIHYDNGAKSAWLAIDEDTSAFSNITYSEDRNMLIADDGMTLYKDETEIGQSIWLKDASLSSEYTEKEISED